MYGTVEASIKVPNVADGLWPAFWTLGSNFSEVGWPRAGEIDIMEIGQGLAINEGVVNRRVVSGAHWENNETYATYALGYDFASDLYLDFHNYTLTWTPTVLATYVDGQKMWEMDISSTSCLDCEEFHHPHFLVLNLAVGGFFTSTGGDGSSGSSGVGSSSAGCVGSSSSSAGVGSSSSGGCGTARTDVSAALPATMMVDYVKIIDNGFTEIIITEVDDGEEAAPVMSPVASTEPPASTPDAYTPTVILVPSPTGAPTVRGTVAPVPVIDFGDEDDPYPEDGEEETDPYPYPEEGEEEGDDLVACADSGKGKGGSSGKGESSGKGSRKNRRGRRLCSSGKGSKSSKKGGSSDLGSSNQYLASGAEGDFTNRVKVAATGCTVAALALLAQ